MSRLLILTRHAKSGWDDPSLEDHDRPLTKRGRRSARAVAGWLRDHDWLPNEVLSSTATRTRETWDRMGLRADKICFHRTLYHAGPRDILVELSGATEHTVIMLGHNPGIAEFASRIVRQAPQHPRLHDYPTCATTVIRFPIDDWAEVQWQTGEVLDFVIPRALLE